MVGICGVCRGRNYSPESRIQDGEAPSCSVGLIGINQYTRNLTRECVLVQFEMTRFTNNLPSTQPLPQPINTTLFLPPSHKRHASTHTATEPPLTPKQSNNTHSTRYKPFNKTPPPKNQYSGPRPRHTSLIMHAKPRPPLIARSRDHFESSNTTL